MNRFDHSSQPGLKCPTRLMPHATAKLPFHPHTFHVHFMYNTCPMKQRSTTNRCNSALKVTLMRLPILALSSQVRNRQSHRASKPKAVLCRQSQKTRTFLVTPLHRPKKLCSSHFRTCHISRTTTCCGHSRPDQHQQH